MSKGKIRALAAATSTSGVGGSTTTRKRTRSPQGAPLDQTLAVRPPSVAEIRAARARALDARFADFLVRFPHTAAYMATPQARLSIRKADALVDRMELRSMRPMPQSCTDPLDKKDWALGIFESLCAEAGDVLAPRITA
jgi:uncharacterized protein (DUF305 family)